MLFMMMVEKKKKKKNPKGEGSPVPENPVKLDDESFLFMREVSPFQVWPQVVNPSQPAALPTSLKS